MKTMSLKPVTLRKLQSSSPEFPHVLLCNENTANVVWMMVRKHVMSIPPDAVFRSHQPRRFGGSAKRLGH